MTNTEKKVNEITCNHCDKKIDERYALWYDDGQYCLDCWLKQGYNKLLIDYNYKPIPTFSKMSFEKNPLFMGIELEVEAGEDTEEYYDNDEDDDYEEEERNYSEYLPDYAYDIMKEYPCYIKYDGSLNSHGMEIVTHPQTLKYHKRIFNWEELLKKLKKDGFTSYSNNRCGMHIHLSKSWFKPEDYLKFNIFFDKNFSVMKCFAKRTRTDYCNKIRSNETRVIAQNKKNTRLADWYDHYKCLYFGNHKTIEIRIFRGTLDIERFNATLDITEALSFFVKSYSLAFFIKTTKKQLWYTFLNFMKQSRRYSKLLKYLEKEKLLYCTLNKIPRQGVLLEDIVIRKPLMELMGNNDIRTYLQNRELKKLEYYFDDFEDYTINRRGDAYYLQDGFFLPIRFEKIIMYNKDYNAGRRKMILDFFFNYGYTVEIQNKNTTCEVKNYRELANALKIDLVKIRREKEKREKLKIAKEEKQKRQDGQNGTYAPPELFNRYLASFDPSQGISADCENWERDKVNRLVREAIANKINRHLIFTIRNTSN